MEYVRIHTGDDGRSHVEDVTLEGELREIVAGVPPVLVSAPQAAAALVSVQQPRTPPHPSPRSSCS